MPPFGGLFFLIHNNSNEGDKIMKKFDLEKENGRSMIEMLGVLAIIGVLSVGGIAGYSKAMMKYRINKTIEQITLIAGNVRTFFANQKIHKNSLDEEVGKYDGVGNNNILRKAKLIPDEMWNSDKTAIKNAFGGDVIVSCAYDTTQVFANAFAINIKDIHQEACIEIVTQNWQDIFEAIMIKDTIPSGDVSIFLAECPKDGSVYISEGNINGGWGCKSDGGMPITIDNAIIACGICSSDNLCDIAFSGE